MKDKVFLDFHLVKQQPDVLLVAFKIFCQIYQFLYNFMIEPNGR